MFATRTGWDLTPNRFSRALEEHRRSGRPILDLTASNPTDCGFIYNQKAILHPLSDAAGMTYEPLAKGLLSARTAVADYYSAKSLAIDPSDILLTTSTSEAYAFIFRLLCNPGDEVLIPRPSYPLFQFLADINDVRLVPYSLLYDHGWQMDFGSLRNSVNARSKAVIIVNPNNPTGSFIKPAEMAELNRICDQHQLALISDEVFHDYTFTSQAPVSLATNGAALTFTLSGLSKVAGLPQMKVAWMVVSGPDRSCNQAVERLDMIADTFLSLNAPLQHALPSLLSSRRELQAQLKARLQANLKELDAQLSAQDLCTRLDVEGGWYANLRVPVTRSDEDLAIELLDKCDVLAHPGHFFDFEQEGYVVLSLMAPEDVFTEATKRILAFVD